MPVIFTVKPLPNGRFLANGSGVNKSFSDPVDAVGCCIKRANALAEKMTHKSNQPDFIVYVYKHCQRCQALFAGSNDFCPACCN